MNQFGFVDFQGQDEESLSDEGDEFGFVDSMGADQDEFEQASLEEAPEKESTAQQIASNPITQAALGITQAVTSPLDLLKLAMMGEGLSGIDELEEIAKREGVEFDRDKYIGQVMKMADLLPTQSLLESYIKEKTGVNLEPRGTISKLARGAGELFNPTKNLVTGTTKQIAKNVGKKTVSSVAGSVGTEALKEAGVPAPLASLVAGTAANVAVGTKAVPKELTPEKRALRETAEKHGLRRFSGLEFEEAPKTPLVSKGKQEVLRKELEETSTKAIDKVLKQELPMKSVREQAGKSLGETPEDWYTAAYKDAHNTAKQMDIRTPKPISSAPIIEWATQQKKEIQQSALSLSSQDKVKMKILDDVISDFTEEVKSPKSKQMMSIPRRMTAEQALNQIKKFNENVKGIYRKPEFSGSEEAVRSTYAALNERLVNSIDRTSSQLGSKIKLANKIFSETSKLDQVENLLSKAFVDGYDPKKLNSIVNAKRGRAFLTRSLGKNAVKDLEDIAKYGSKAESEVISKLKNPKTVGEWASEMTPLKLALILGGKTVAAPIALPYSLVKELTHRAQGYLFTRDATKPSYINYLKAAATGSPTVFAKASRDLDKAISKEFGSEEEFLDFLQANTTQEDTGK